MNDLDSSSSYNKRLLLVLAAGFLVMVAWGYIAPRPVPPPAEIAAAPAPTAPLPLPSPEPLPASGELQATEVAPAEVVAVAESAPRRVVASTPHWRVELSNVGGRLTSWQLLDEEDYADPARPLELVRRRMPRVPEGQPQVDAAALPADDAQDLLPLQVLSGDVRVDSRLASAIHVVTSEDLPGKRVLTAKFSDGAGLAVEKILTLHDGVPLATLEASLTVEGRPVPFRLAWGPGIGNHRPSQRTNVYFKRGSVAWLAGDKVRLVERPDKQKDLPETPVAWAGLEDSYFAVVFTPMALASSPSGSVADGAAQGFRISGALSPNEKGKLDKSDWPDELVLEVPFTPEQSVQVVHAGPRHRPALRALDAEFRQAPRLAMLTHLGMLDGIARLLHVPMLKFHAWTGSWGLAIVLLTVLVRVVIAPFQFYSMKKMRGMQDKMKPVQARLKALDERFKKLPPSRENRMKQMEEKQRLMLEAGVNPADTLSGCLPMLMTMPVFFALLKLLPSAPEFRHEPFLTWVDLSAADPTHILPIAAAVLTLISTKMGMSSSGTTIDPMQRNMLYMFPLMLIWLCWSAPLAFVVYQVVMSFVQIGQQQLFNMALPRPQAEAGLAPPRSGKTSRDEHTVETASAPRSGQAAGVIRARKKGRKR